MSEVNSRTWKQMFGFIDAHCTRVETRNIQQKKKKTTKNTYFCEGTHISEMIVIG